MRKSIVFLGAAVLVAAAALAATFKASAGENGPRESTPAPVHMRWSREAVETFADLPVQDGGRVKPLSTFAKFTLLALNGKSSVKTPSGETLNPTEWLMDCFFFPYVAKYYDCFVVDDSGVLDAAGLAHEGKGVRDRYSYVDFEPARQRIFELASQYEQVDEKERGAVQGQLINLAKNLMEFEAVASLVGPSVRPPEAADSPGLTKVFGKEAHPRMSDVLGHAAELKPFLTGGDPHAAAGGGAADVELTNWVEEVVSASRGLALLPPSGSVQANSEWLSPSDLVRKSLYQGDSLKEQVAELREIEAMDAAREDPYAFRTHADAFKNLVVPAAEARGEYGKIPLEVTFYRADFFFYSQMAFVLAFLLVAFTWMKPAKLLQRGAIGSVGLATLLLVAGITMRCIIRGRPPVSTLYESILFITGVASIALLITEYVNRRGIALALSTVIGAAGLFLANRYEVQEHVDTMPSLVAVLDTNFWLSSHVTTVTIGYCAGILAGAVGHVYVIRKVFDWLLGRKSDPAFYKTLTNMTYGMLCFGLLFSVVGTVLGGIWANESWGRFWGWDPKENGALTIVLWELIVLHARMGGYLRDFGVAMASIFGAAVVAASWWGVNLLGVGLHSYGFTSGVLWALLIYFGVEALVLSIGAVYWWCNPAVASVSVPGGPPPIPPSVPSAQRGA